MDPSSALAIAAAIFQFLEVGGKLLANSSEKFMEMQQGTSDQKTLAQERYAFYTIFEDLSFQTSWIRQIEADTRSFQFEITRAQAELLYSLSNCKSLSSAIEKVKRKIKENTCQIMYSQKHIKSHVLGDSSRSKERDCRECQKMNEKRNTKLKRIMEIVESISNLIEPMKRNTIDSMVLCLWGDAKRAPQWALHFRNQLDKTVCLLGKIHHLTAEGCIQPLLSHSNASAQNQNHHITDEEVDNLLKALKPLTQPGMWPLSLKKMAETIDEYFKTESKAKLVICDDLLSYLWKKDWKLEHITTGDTLVNMDTAVVANAIASGIRFNTVQIYENASSAAIVATYSRIFQIHPPKRDNTPIWSSFPQWLRGSSNKIYWIIGKPGSGKSTIMNLISQHKSTMDDLFQPPGLLCFLLVKYYAWLADGTLQNSLEGLKRSVIIQALEQCPELAPVLAPRRWMFCQVPGSASRLPTWDKWEIEESFEALLSSCGKTVKLILLIDAMDEFDEPPSEIIKCIGHMKARCPRGLKICATIRSWRKFEAEFRADPRLEMHLMTGNDIKTLIQEKFKNNHRYAEQKLLYPEATSQLLLDMVQRSNGVFLWARIVGELYSNEFSRGQSMPQARKALESLPSDISSLYGTIWKSIPTESLSDASYMMQVLRAYGDSISWKMFWFIEEKRFCLEDAPVYLREEERFGVLRLLQRKIAARTNGILRIGADGSVDFVHHTASDWAAQPENWQLISSFTDERFDPYLCILKGEISLCFNRDDPPAVMWNAMVEILLRAAQVKDDPKNALEFVKTMKTVEKYFDLLKVKLAIPDRPDIPASVRIGFQLHNIDPTFLGLTAQFSILAYIKAVALLEPDSLDQKFSKKSLGLLENAIFGRPRVGWNITVSNHIPLDRRLATVKYLLERGVYQSRVHSVNGGTKTIRKRISQVSYSDREFYSTVVTYLNERDRLGSLRSRITHVL
ncbi:hypothetical protein V8C35DRAFT_333614 [Trichoderma chlorosporum]